MDARELRIGNLVNYQTAEGDILVARIDWQGLKWISKDEKGFNIAHSAIPLTEEWLLRFGFVKEVEYKKKINFSRFHLFQINASNSYNDNENEFKVNFYQSKQCVELCRIKHVHQLQNLYFALTGEELTLKTK